MCASRELQIKSNNKIINGFTKKIARVEYENGALSRRQKRYCRIIILGEMNILREWMSEYCYDDDMIILTFIIHIFAIILQICNEHIEEVS